MKNLIFAFFAILLCYGNGWTQCPSSNTTFKTQQEIDDFAASYPNCTILNGKLTIDGLSPQSDITDLMPFSQLVGIGGDLVISSNDSLSTLAGLGNLKSIGGTLRIENNTAINDLTGLNNLNSIGNSLAMADNSNLNTLTGLESLNFVGGSVTIVDHTSLSSLSGLDNLLILGNSLILQDIEVLSDLTALSNITFLGGELEISSTPALTDLSGLENISNIGGTLSITATGVTSLKALENLTGIGGFLRIIFNDNLTELTGLDNIDHLTIVSLEILENPNLAICGIENVCYYLSEDLPALVFNNALGCNYPNVVCGSCPTQDVTLLTQQEVDEFGLLYPNCDEFNYSLTIGQFSAQNDISDLSPLNQLELVGGNLRISGCDSLTTLVGLENIEDVDGNLIISDNNDIKDLTGLNDLNFIGGDLFIENNGNLNNLGGLDKLNYIGGDFTVSEGSPALTDLDGIEMLSALDGALILADNVVLFDLAALSNLTTIGGGMTIDNNPALTDLKGLENITDIGGDLRFYRTALTNFAELEKLTAIGGGLSITFNNDLTELTGLDNIDLITSPPYLEIYDNPNLAICDIDNICLYLSSVVAPTVIKNNAPGCDTPENVCPPCKPIDSEDFEEGWGIWIDGGSDAQRVSKVGYATSETYSINIQDNSSQSVVTTQNLDLGKYSFVAIDFSFYAVSMDAGESFFVEVAVDGGQGFDFGKEYKVGEDFENNKRYTVNVPFSIPLTSQTKIRFRCNASSNSDDVYLDDISITACTTTCPMEALPCDDGDPCTEGEAYDINCNCTGGIFQDEDGDGTCDNDDICPDFDNNLIGTPCDDGNICTFNDRYDGDCDCTGTYIGDTDLDGICNTEDPCPDQPENVCNDYCEAQGTRTTYEYIQNVELGVDNETGNDGGYGDYTYLPGLIIGGYDIPIVLTPGFTEHAFDENWVVWIDLNKDGDFEDAGEEVFSGTSYGTQPLEGIIHVPASFGLARMRVAMRWKKDPLPCGQFRYGEVEDYIVDLSPLPDTKLSSDVSVQTYPNPASSYVNVDLHDIISNSNIQSVTAMIYNMSGQQVHTEELNATGVLTINTHHLPEGSYILRLSADDGRTFTGKFVKM